MFPSQKTKEEKTSEIDRLYLTLGNMKVYEHEHKD